MLAFAMPIKANSRDLQTAICVVGLTRQVPSSSIRGKDGEQETVLKLTSSDPDFNFRTPSKGGKVTKPSTFSEISHFSLDNRSAITYNYFTAT